MICSSALMRCESVSADSFKWNQEARGRMDARSPFTAEYGTNYSVFYSVSYSVSKDFPTCLILAPATMHGERTTANIGHTVRWGWPTSMEFARRHAASVSATH